MRFQTKVTEGFSNFNIERMKYKATSSIPNGGSSGAERTSLVLFSFLVNFIFSKKNRFNLLLNPQE